MEKSEYYIEAAFPEGMMFKNFLISTLAIERDSTVLTFRKEGITMFSRKRTGECTVFMSIDGSNLLEYAFEPPEDCDDEDPSLSMDIGLSSSKSSFDAGKKTNKLNLIYRHKDHLTLEFITNGTTIHNSIPITIVEEKIIRLPRVETNIYKCNSTELQNIFLNCHKIKFSLSISSLCYDYEEDESQEELNTPQGIKFGQVKQNMEMESEIIVRNKIKNSRLFYEQPDRYFKVVVGNDVVKALSAMIKTTNLHVIKINGTSRKHGIVRIQHRLGTYATVDIYLKNPENNEYRS